jgi:lipopolysaccharide transport system permease protein
MRGKVLGTATRQPVARHGNPGSLVAHLRELLRYRELIYNLTVRELKARYKSSVLGFFWSLLNPLGMMVVFTVVFTIMMPNNQIRNFPIFVLCGLLPWNFFSAGIMSGTNSVVANGELLKKVYFPREVLAIATTLSNLINFLLALLVLFVAVAIFRTRLSSYIWMLPIVILIQACFVLGMSFILSTLQVFYRDTMMIMDVVMLAWFFLTPVFYPIETLPQSYVLLGVDLDIRRIMYVINPMASLISTYRDLIYWGYRTDLDFILRTALTAIAVLIFGYWFSLRYSRRFGEEV